MMLHPSQTLDLSADEAVSVIIELDAQVPQSMRRLGTFLCYNEKKSLPRRGTGGKHELPDDRAV